jgi:hypothetical protein
MSFGTLQLLDTLAAQRTSIADYGEDNAYQAISAYLQAHNRIVTDMIGDLCEVTTDRLRRYGGVASMKMQRGDEYSRPNAQKMNAGVDVGFPLEMYQIGIQWTRKYFQMHTVSELEAQVNAAVDADLQRVILEIQRAIYTPTNNTSYVDHLFDANSNISLPIRAFLNADSTAIPADPWGNTFTASSHTHYIATASFTAADLLSLITLIKEHYNTGTIKVYINQAQESTVRGFTGFTPLYDPRIVLAQTTAYVQGTLDLMNVYDRKIGVFDAAEIWVKPWPLANYPFAFNPMQRKPLAFRTMPGDSGGLQMVADNETFPLRAQIWERDFGVGVQERANGAVLYTGGGSYTAPSLAA